MADPFGLGMRALREREQFPVAGLRRMIAKLAKEVHNLKEAHKRQGERLNSLIAAFVKEGTRPVERSRCMPLRTVDLSFKNDGDVDEKAAAAEVAQNADQAQGSANSFIRKFADDKAKLIVRVAAASTASSGARQRVKLKRGSILPLSTPYWMQRRRPCAGAVERMPLRTIDLRVNDDVVEKSAAAEVKQKEDQDQGSANAFIRKLADDEAKLKVRVAAASTASSGARERVKLKRGSILPLSTPYWTQRRRPCAGAVERMPLRTIPLNFKQGSLLPLAPSKPGSHLKPKPENH